jgi:hypothetical protein
MVAVTAPRRPGGRHASISAATCMVGHPDKLLSNGINSYTYVARGALKKLLPTCAQPSATQLNAAASFQKRQQDIYNANEQKAIAQLNAPPPPPPGGAAAPGQPAPYNTADERAIRRCVTSGRLAATCTGNSLLGAFGQMLGSVLPGANKEPKLGPVSGRLSRSASGRLRTIKPL